MQSNFVYAMLLTTGAGLATTLGSAIGLSIKKPGPKFMGFSLGFSAGVMILVSFMELLPDSITAIGFKLAYTSFFLGMILFFIIDVIVPHEYIGQHDHGEINSSGKLMHTGFLVALGICIHNLPEGMATFVGTMEDVNLGIAIAVAIAIHNIPEGMAVSVPIYAATGSRKKALFWSFLSGISEPVGAGIAGLILLPFLTPQLLGWVLAFVGGIMVAISIDELVPVAKSFDTEHTPIIGFILGMLVMVFSLSLLGG